MTLQTELLEFENWTRYLGESSLWICKDDLPPNMKLDNLTWHLQACALKMLCRCFAAIVGMLIVNLFRVWDL